MNTTLHHRRTTAFAIVVLAIALPLAACQSPASSGGDRGRECVNGYIAQGAENPDDALKLCLARGHRVAF